MKPAFDLDKNFLASYDATMIESVPKSAVVTSIQLHA
jgi:hypothetical protein